MHSVEFIAFYLLFFLIGGIPFGQIIAKFKKIDLRQIGSGNIGTINVYRALGLKYAVLVFALDAIKGAVPVLLAQWFYGRGHLEGLAGLVAVFGHIFSPYLKFKGGKGVATGFGAMLVISPIPALASLAIWAILIALFKIASLASIVSAISLPALILIFKQDKWILLTALAIVLAVIVSHYENLFRILQGKEKPIK